MGIKEGELGRGEDGLFCGIHSSGGSVPCTDVSPVPWWVLYPFPCKRSEMAQGLRVAQGKSACWTQDRRQGKLMLVRRAQGMVTSWKLPV